MKIEIVSIVVGMLLSVIAGCAKCSMDSRNDMPLTSVPAVAPELDADETSKAPAPIPGARKATPFTSPEKYAGEISVVPSIRLPHALIWYGIDAAVTSSVADSNEQAARDDNLLTSWKCPMSGTAPCVYTLKMARSAEVCAIRLFATDGETSRAARAQGYTRALRVHTDEGAETVTLARRFNYQTIVFPQCVTTDVVSLEAVDFHLPSTRPEMTLAEVELLGRTGPRRAPLWLNDGIIVSASDGPFWVWNTPEEEGVGYSGSSTTAAWLEVVNGRGIRKRVLRGHQALFSNSGRFVLVTTVLSEYCPGATHHRRQQFTLLDTLNRTIYSTDFANIKSDDDIFELADIQRHRSEDAFAVKLWPFSGAGGDTLAILKMDNERTRVGIEPNDAPPFFNSDDRLKTLGFSNLPSTPQPEVETVSPALRARLCRQIPLYNGKSADADRCREAVDNQDWRRFPLGDSRSLIYASMDTCGAMDGLGHSFVALLNADGRVVDSLSSPMNIQLKMDRGQAPLIEIPDAGLPTAKGATPGIYILGADGRFTNACPNAVFELPTSPDCLCSA